MVDFSIAFEIGQCVEYDPGPWRPVSIKLNAPVPEDWLENAPAGEGVRAHVTVPTSPSDTVVEVEQRAIREAIEMMKRAITDLTARIA